MPPSLKLNAAAFISPQNHPILIRTFARQDEHAIQYHYIAHTSLDIIEERGLQKKNNSHEKHRVDGIAVTAAGKGGDCYLGLLYTLEDVAVYGYITPLKVKIVLALALTDSVVKDMDILTVRATSHSSQYDGYWLILQADIQSDAHGLL